jgi:hypothetical protein
MLSRCLGCPAGSDCSSTYGECEITVTSKSTSTSTSTSKSISASTLTSTSSYTSCIETNAGQGLPTLTYMSYYQKATILPGQATSICLDNREVS